MSSTATFALRAESIAKGANVCGHTRKRTLESARRLDAYSALKEGSRRVFGRRRRKRAFQQSNFWDNAGIAIFVVVSLIGLWFLMTSVIKW